VIIEGVTDPFPKFGLLPEFYIALVTVPFGCYALTAASTAIPRNDAFLSIQFVAYFLG